MQVICLYSIHELKIPAIFWQLLLRNGIISIKSLIWNIFIFQTREHSVETADESSKVTSHHFNWREVLYIFKLVFYFNSVMTSNYIKHYLAINRGYFLQILAMMACYWKSMYQKIKEVKAWSMTIWSIMVEAQSFATVWNRSCKFLFFVLCFCFFCRRGWNNQCPGNWQRLVFY